MTRSGTYRCRRALTGVSKLEINLATNDPLDLVWLPRDSLSGKSQTMERRRNMFYRCAELTSPVPVAYVEGNAMSDDDLKAELERLRQENATLKKGVASGLRLKVSEKGALSVYGMGRFPVTLYKEQWLKLLNIADDIRAFIAANERQLKAKNQD